MRRNSEAGLGTRNRVCSRVWGSCSVAQLHVPTCHDPTVAEGDSVRAVEFNLSFSRYQRRRYSENRWANRPLARPGSQKTVLDERARMSASLRMQACWPKDSPGDPRRFVGCFATAAQRGSRTTTTYGRSATTKTGCLPCRNEPSFSNRGFSIGTGVTARPRPSRSHLIGFTASIPDGQD